MIANIHLCNPISSDMRTEDYDIVIIGAGPIGSRAGTVLSNKGLKVCILEEHEEIGRPFQCAGLVNPSAMEIVGLNHTILETIHSAKMHSPSGIDIQIGQPHKARTYTVCRKKFDQGVAKQAIDSGAKIYLNSKPLDASVSENEIRIESQIDDEVVMIKAKLLIGADGAHSWTRRKFKLGRPKEFMIGYQVEVTGFETEDGVLEMYTGKDIAPGFFAWAIPTGFGTHRIGMWSTAKLQNGKSSKEMLSNLMYDSKWSNRFENCSIVAQYCGPVPSGMVKKPYCERVLLLGDAAGIAKPTTGGGIGPGFEQIELAADDIYSAVKNADLSEKNLKRIAKSWNKLKNDHETARKLRNLLVSDLTDEQLDSHFKEFAKPEIIDLINSVADIEKPVPIGIALLKKVPAFRKLALKSSFVYLFG